MQEEADVNIIGLGLETGWYPGTKAISMQGLKKLRTLKNGKAPGLDEVYRR